MVHTTIYFAWQTPLNVTNNIPKGLFLYWSYQVFISIGTLLVTFNYCGKPGSSRQVHSNCWGIPQCIQATLAHKLRTCSNPCCVDALYLGTNAAGHVPEDSICDVQFLVITMHHILHFSILVWIFDVPAVHRMSFNFIFSPQRQPLFHLVWYLLEKYQCHLIQSKVYLNRYTHNLIQVYVEKDLQLSSSD